MGAALVMQPSCWWPLIWGWKKKSSSGLESWSSWKHSKRNSSAVSPAYDTAWLTASQCLGCLGRQPWRYCPAALSDTGTNGEYSAASWNSGTACGFSGVQHSIRRPSWKFGIWDNSFRFNFSMFSYLGFAIWLGSVVTGKIKMVSVCFHSPH